MGPGRPRERGVVLAVAIAAGLLTTHPQARQAPPEALPTLTTPDFDGDGFADLAVGVPDDSIVSDAEAGAVEVLYGSAAASSAGNHEWDQDSAGIPGATDPSDHVGSAFPGSFRIYVD